MIRVLLVEGDQAERAALARALGAVSGIEVVGQVGDGSVAPSAVMALNPDVVVLAAQLPTIAGPDAAALLAALEARGWRGTLEEPPAAEPAPPCGGAASGRWPPGGAPRPVPAAGPSAVGGQRGSGGGSEGAERGGGRC